MVAKFNYEHWIATFRKGMGTRQIALWIIGLLSLALLGMLYQIIRMFINFSHLPEVALSSNQKKNNSQASIPLAEIPNWHLMGHAPAKTTDMANLPESTLNIKLLGILHASDPALSQAIISLDDGVSKVYLINDRLEERAVVKEILANSVIINREGVLEKIELPTQPVMFEPPPKGLASP